MPDPAISPAFDLTTDLDGIKWNPIVKLRSPTLGYLAYMHRETPFSSKDSYNVRVVRIARDPMMPTAAWNATTILALDSLQINGTIQGAVRDWRDWIPVSFDIGEGDLCVDPHNCQRSRRELPIQQA